MAKVILTIVIVFALSLDLASTGKKDEGRKFKMHISSRNGGNKRFFFSLQTLISSIPVELRISNYYSLIA